MDTPFQLMQTALYKEMSLNNIIDYILSIYISLHSKNYQKIPRGFKVILPIQFLKILFLQGYL